MSELCPNCSKVCIRKFEGKVLVLECMSCGYEKAVSRQTDLMGVLNAI